MDIVNLEQPAQQLIGLGSIGGLIGVLAYMIGRYRAGTRKAEVEANEATVKSNETLRALINDQNSKIESMERKQNLMLNEIKDLKDRILVLSSRNTNLERLIVEALSNFFSDHPNQALKIRQQLDEAMQPELPKDV